MPNMRTRERVFSVLAIICGLIGGFGLLFLSIFDTKRFPNEHRIFLLVFIVGVGFSAIFSVIEVCTRFHSADPQVLLNLNSIVGSVKISRD